MHNDFMFQISGDATGNTIDKADGIDSDGFYLQISVAQFGIWLSFTVWVTLLAFSMVKLCRYHHQENLRVSMAKERKRLLNEDLVSEVPIQVRKPPLLFMFSACGGLRTGNSMPVFKAYFPLKWLRAFWGMVDSSWHHH